MLNKYGTLSESFILHELSVIFECHYDKDKELLHHNNRTTQSAQSSKLVLTKIRRVDFRKILQC